MFLRLASIACFFSTGLLSLESTPRHFADDLLAGVVAGASCFAPAPDGTQSCKTCVQLEGQPGYYQCATQNNSECADQHGIQYLPDCAISNPTCPGTYNRYTNRVDGVCFGYAGSTAVSCDSAVYQLAYATGQAGPIDCGPPP